MRAVPQLCELYLGICLATEELRKKHWKTSVRIAEECQLARWKQNMQTRKNIQNRICTLLNTPSGILEAGAAQPASDLESSLHERKTGFSFARNCCLPLLGERVTTARELLGTKFQKTLIFTVPVTCHTRRRLWAYQCKNSEFTISQKAACPCMLIYRTLNVTFYDLIAILNKIVAFYNVTPCSFVTGVKVLEELTVFPTQ